MAIFSFLKKLRRPRTFIPDSSTVNLLTDLNSGSESNSDSNGRKSAKKMKSSTPILNRKGSNTQSISSSRHSSKKTILSKSLLNQRPAMSAFGRKSIRRSSKKKNTSRRVPSIKVKRVTDNTFDTNEADLSLLPSILNESVFTPSSTITLHGCVTDQVLSSLCSGIGKLKKIVFDEVRITSSPSYFTSMIKNLQVESIAFLGCKFDDAQILSDNFFEINKQLIDITIGTNDGTWQSFPLLTDRTLDRWATSGRQPPCIQFHNIDTSFTIQGVQRLIRSFISIASPYDRFCCKLSRVNSSMDTVINQLSRLPGLKVHRVHTTFIYALSHNPRIELNLQTQSLSDDSIEDIPMLRRSNALRILSSPKAVKIYKVNNVTKDDPISESIKITKPGVLSRAKRVSLVRNKRKSKRVAKSEDFYTALKSKPSIAIM